VNVLSICLWFLAMQGADSDEVARVYRYEAAHQFRDDVAHLSNLISPSGEAFWVVSFMASVKLRAFCCGHMGKAIALSKRSGMFTAPRAQVFRADDGVRRRLLSLDEARSGIGGVLASSLRCLEPAWSINGP